MPTFDTLLYPVKDIVSLAATDSTFPPSRKAGLRHSMAGAEVALGAVGMALGTAIIALTHGQQIWFACW